MEAVAQGPVGRALAAKFAVKENFLDFVREVDDVMRKIEQKDITKFQMVINGMFHNLRLLNRISKRLPGKRFWRFSGGTELVLTLVPPHRTYGPLTAGVMEPIYCGAWHSAANIATFCPGRDYITMSFSMEQRHIDNVDKIMTLLDRVLGRLDGEMARSHKLTLYRRLRPALLVEEQAPTYSEVAASLGLTEGAVKMAAHRLRGRYRQLLRDEIGRTVADPAEIDGEIAALLAAIGT